nr:hypothetical protein [Tanacetum cinerariifolium]
MGDEVISTTPAKENNELIKSSVDDLVPIPRESEVTLVCEDLEYDMNVNTPFPTTDVREEDFDINSPLGEYLVDFLMENVDGMSDEPLGDDSKPKSFDVTFSNPLFDFNDDSTLCYDNSLFDEEFEDISSLDLFELTPVIDESTLLVTLPLPYLVVLGDEKIDLLLRDDLDTLLTRDKEIDFNHCRDIEELECLLANDHVPVPRVFDELLGNSDSMSRPIETSDLILEELTTEIGLDDSVSSKIDDRYYDLEDLPLPDPKQICLREVETFDPFFSLTQSGGTTRVMETPSFSSLHMPSPRPAAYSPTE